MPVVISTGLLAGENFPLREHVVLGGGSGGRVRYHRQRWEGG